MRKQIKRIATAAASGAILLSTAVPAFAAVDLTVTGNGAGSDNEIKLETGQATVVEQSNETDVSNTVVVNSNTGGNKVSGTTGGEVWVETGDATTKVNIANELNSNVAHVDTCDCDGEDIWIDISGNGAKSDNDVKVKSASLTALVQENEADIDNKVLATTDTGDNTVKGTTGGDVTILTGDAKVKVDIDNIANSNIGMIGGSTDGPSALDILIKKNGYKSDNTVKVEIEQATVLEQDNETDIDNFVGAGADTGENSAKGTTGGEVAIVTGDAKVKVDIDNTAGFNTADIDCGCLSYDLSATIKKNGAKSDNKIKAEIKSALAVSQDNSCGGKSPKIFSFKKSWGKDDECFDNKVFANTNTGDNTVKGSTDGEDGDPLVWTGHSLTDVIITNYGGSNVYGFDW
jgi:hypothetical protein